MALAPKDSAAASALRCARFRLSVARLAAPEQMIISKTSSPQRPENQHGSRFSGHPLSWFSLGNLFYIIYQF
jgi:hypothetical protein